MKTYPTFTARCPRACGSFLVMICLSLLLSALPALSITLIDGGSTNYVIAKQTGCDTTTSTAATDIQTYLRTISGGSVTIPINSYANLDAVPAQAIVIGNLVTSPTLALEQVEIKVVDQRLILRGGSSTAHRYAVFTFLEAYLGCRFYAPTVEYIPSINPITVANDYDGTHTPSFAYRYIYQQDVTANSTWCVKNRCNGQVSIDGTHNMYTAVPPGTYFATHPEYYPLHSGARTYNTTNQWLCFTNPDLPAIIASYVNGRMAATNANAIVNIGQGDWSDSCECTTCQASYAANGNAWSGPLLGCINAAADIVAQSYPSRKMMTFAYMHTDKPPTNVTPRSNLVIRLVHWRYCDLHALTYCSAQDSFQTKLAGWDALTSPENLYIWQYVTNFKSQAAVWPNVRSLVADCQEYYNNGVRGIYEQGVYWGRGGDLGWLKPYLMAKALWDVSVDATTVYNDFTNGYYGDAGDEMRTYIDRLEDQVASWHPNGITVTLDQILSNALPTATFTQADADYDAAETAALNVSQALYDRVHADRYSLLFMHTYNKKQFSRISDPADRLVKNGDNNYYLWKEAFNSILGNRGCGDEYQCDARARQNWRSIQGGDVVSIENDNIKISVCPWVQGTMISLVDKTTGKELMHLGKLYADSTNYPFNGGCSDAVYNSGGTLYPRVAAASSSVTTDGDGNQILTVVSEFGIGTWSPSVVTHRTTRTITLPPDDATSFTLSVKEKNIYTSTFSTERVDGRVALGGDALYYTNIVATLPDDSTQQITTFPTTLNAKQIAYDNTEYGIRLTRAFSAALPTTSVTISKNNEGTLNTIFTKNNTGTNTLTASQEVEVLNETWTLSSIGSSPMAGEQVVWTNCVNTESDPQFGGLLRKSAGGSSYNADAQSTKTLSGDGWVEWRLLTNGQNQFVGLNPNDPDNARNIRYAIRSYTSSGTTYCRAWETNADRGTAQVVAPGDVLRVERVGTTVYYKKNGVTFYTSAVASSGSLLVDTCLYYATASYSPYHCRIYGFN